MTPSPLRGAAWPAAVCAALLAVTFAPGADPKPAELTAGPYRLSGPYTHENLTVFLIHGDDQVKGKNFLTLQEALEQKKVVVHETQNVNELSVENVSPADEVFIQAGDIVKGGQQDRVLSVDLIVSAKSGKVPVSSFCVESGRWTRRGAERPDQFSDSREQLATKDLKLAARASGSQSEVWKKVALCQELLRSKLGTDVRAGESASSLQLTLEHKKLLEALDGTIKKLTPIVEGHKDVIGYAFAINGKVNSGDVYGNTALFQKLWPKLLKATAVEAVVEREKDKKFDDVKPEAMRAFLLDAESGKAKEKEITRRVQAVQRETEKNLLFETRDKDNKDGAVRKSYIAK